MDASRLADLRAFYADEPTVDAPPGDGPARRAEEVRAAGGDPTPWEKGAQGERLFAAEVASALAGWTVLHSLPKLSASEVLMRSITGTTGPSPDIDHLLIGPGGVFTINTKNLNYNLQLIRPNCINDLMGQRDFGREAIAEAAHASGCLSRNWPSPVAVTPVVVAVNFEVSEADFELASGEPEQVVLLALREAVSWFESRRAALSAMEVEALSFWARLEGVWRGQRYLGAADSDVLVRQSSADSALVKKVSTLLARHGVMTPFQLFKEVVDSGSRDLERVLAESPDFVETEPGSAHWRLRS